MKMDINTGDIFIFFSNFDTYNIGIDQVFREVMKNNWHFIALLFKFSMSGFFSLLHVEFLLASKLSLIATF